jgi:hypothetical protein
VLLTETFAENFFENKFPGEKSNLGSMLFGPMYFFSTLRIVSFVGSAFRKELGKVLRDCEELKGYERLQEM